MIENIRLSFQGIWSHKMRSFLTMLGIIIGIASIISIVSTIKGTNEQIKKNLIGSGTNTVQIQLYQGDYQYEMLYNGLPDGIPVRDETTMEKIKSVKNVEDAAFYTSRSDYNNSVYYGNNGISGSHYSLKNEPKYLFITGKRVCVFLIRNANSFVIITSPKVEPFVV